MAFNSANYDAAFGDDYSTRAELCQCTEYIFHRARKNSSPLLPERYLSKRNFEQNYSFALFLGKGDKNKIFDIKDGELLM